MDQQSIKEYLAKLEDRIRRMEDTNDILKNMRSDLRLIRNILLLIFIN